MNQIKGKLIHILSQGTLSLVTLNVGSTDLQSIIIDTPESVPYLRKDAEINILFKETELILATDQGKNISIGNRLSCNIKEIERGKLLSRIVLDFENQEIISVVTTLSLDELGLKEGQAVTGLVKTNEVMISE